MEEPVLCFAPVGDDDPDSPPEGVVEELYQLTATNHGCLVA